MATLKNASDEAQIRKGAEEWAQAIHDKDADRVIAHYAPQVLTFDLAPPLQYKRGSAARKQLLEAWFKTWDGPIAYEIRDLEIEIGGDIAFAHSLNRISGTKTDGEKPDVWVRSTVGYRKIDGKWLVTHEHASVPFDMTTLKASLDLTP